MDSPPSTKTTRKSPPTSNKKMKNVPIELTSYGTTPSGKPRLFVCQVCTRAFARLEHLRRHERSHTKEKPFSCGVCQRKFSRRDLLLRHAQKLHAGCADAITRLRRKSIKRSNSLSSQSSNTLINNSSPIDEDYDSKDITLDKKFKSLATSGALSKKFDPVQFNLNLFDHTKVSRSNSLTNGSTPTQTPQTPGYLQRQVFDRKKAGRHRGASFSAQSGANYAIGLPEFNDSYPGADNVEFSTPQLLPSTMSDESSWLHNLSSIPGMNDHGSPFGVQRQNNSSTSKNHQNRGSFSSISLENTISTQGELPNHPSHHGSFSAQNQMLRSDSLLSSSSYSNFDSMGSYPYMMPTATVTSENSSKAATELPRPTNNDDDSGYSFYDIPESMLLTKFDHFKVPHSLTPIRQEDDDELMELPEATHTGANTSQQSNSITTNGVNFDLNFLYDIDELAHEYDVNTKFGGGGYSFYGDNPSVSSSGIESSNSPPHITPPSRSAQDQLTSHFETNNKFLNQSQILNINASNPKASTTNPVNSNHHLLGKYTKNKLFTSNMRYMINKALSKYPISGIMTPTIPSNEKLEFYLNNFITIFLYHFPFIHISKLNEYEIMNMTINEDNSNESARVCLPLLIATIGSLLANNKNDSEHLYEASRRIIHIYLESRKNSVSDQNGGGLNGNSVNPLWLIQSLTLSVIYGLFSDNENNVYIVIRQLNALNSLVKTSIKSNRTILFSINGEDEKIFNQINYNTNEKNSFGENPNNTHELDEMLNSNSLFNNNFFNINDEIKMKNNIMIQSQTRIVFMIYRLTNFLLMTYNVPLTLSINDLGNLKSPNKNDEFLWNFKNFQAFQEYNQSMNNNRNIDYYLSTSNQIVFKDVLLQLTKTHFDNNTGASPIDQENLDAKLSNLSKYGFISIVHGVFEIKQYDDLKRINVFNVLDHLTKFITDDSNDDLKKLNQYKRGHNHHQPIHDDFEKLDYALLINFIKISSLIDFKLFKEQSWLKNYEELTKNYHIFLNSLENINEADYLKIIDSCIVIIKLVLFKTETNDSANGNSKAKLSKDSDEVFQNQLNYYQSHRHTVNELVNESLSSQGNSNVLEKSIKMQVFDEIDNSKNSIHSQMLFHIFTILSIFAISVVKRNHQANNGFANGNNDSNLQQMNQRFIVILRLFNKVENFLKIKYQNSKLENDLTNLWLFSNLSVNDEDLFKNNNQNPNNCFNYSLEKSLYILKLGELVLSYLYDTNVKVSIFKKLSESLSQIRKFLIDMEPRILS